MRIILLEAAPEIDSETIKKFPSMSGEEKDQVIDNIMQQYDNPSLENIRDVIEDAFKKFGINPDVNQFVNYFGTIDFKVSNKMKPNFEKLVQMYGKGLIKKIAGSTYHNIQNLFERSTKDFEYTVNAFEIASDPQQVKKYFVDTTVVNTNKFYNKDGTIKDAGNESTKNDTNTIYGTIEKWSEGNDTAQSGPQSGNGYSLNDVMSRMKLDSDTLEKNLIDKMGKLFSDYKVRSIYKPTKKVDEYLSKLRKIFGAVEDLNVNMDYIRDKRHYKTLQDVPERFKDGQSVVYVTQPSLSDATEFGITDNYVIYQDGVWKNYKDVKKEQKKIKSIYDKLMNFKGIKDESNWYAIVAGTIYALDTMKI